MSNENTWRIKTESEFIAEFGEDWKDVVGWLDDGNRGHLFGMAANSMAANGNALHVQFPEHLCKRLDLAITDVPLPPQKKYWNVCISTASGRHYAIMTGSCKEDVIEQLLSSYKTEIIERINITEI